MDRQDVLQIAGMEDLEKRNIHFDSISDPACALLGHQRTKQISRRARVAWQAGNPRPMRREVRERRDEIIRGAMLEIYQEYLPLRKALGGVEIDQVCDIGCGQAINDVFLHLDHAPQFTLVDIETTPEQYHNWADTGSGYADLAAARLLLMENGCADADIRLINPRQTPWSGKDASFDLVTSLYSCGFHYPIDDYLELFLGTLESGGRICLDLRNRYTRSGSEALKRLMAAADTSPVYTDARSVRMLFSPRESAAD